MRLPLSCWQKALLYLGHHHLVSPMRSFGLLCGAVMAACTMGCSSSLCDNVTKATVTSPDHHKLAIFSVADCGATTPYATRVQISDRSSWLARNMVVFVIKGDYDASDIRLSWIDNNHLEVNCPACIKSSIVRETSTWNGIDIRYNLP